MDIAEKTLLLKQDIDEVYDKGFNDGYGTGYNSGVTIGQEQGYNEGYSQSESDFWENILKENMTRNYMQYMFYRWSCEYIRPSQIIKSGVRTSNRTIVHVFAYNDKLKAIEKQYFDFSAYVPVASPISSTGGIYGLCDQCTALEVFEDIGLQGGAYYRTWNTCKKLHTIEVMRCVADGVYSAVFTNCNSLANISIEGEIGTSFEIHYSPLSTASIVSIIEHLSDTSGATLTLNTNAVNSMVFPYTSPYTNITYNSWDELIATKTNWTISTTTA